MIKEHQNKIGFETPHMDLYDNKSEDKGTRDKRRTITRFTRERRPLAPSVAHTVICREIQE